MRVASFLVLSVLLAACSSPGPGPELDLPPGFDEPPTHLDERALLLLLSDRRVYEPYTVERALKGDRGLREELARTLGRIGDPRALMPLLDLLADRVPEVRREAAFALGEIGDPEAVAGLFWAVGNADRETGTLAVEALLKQGVETDRILAAIRRLPETEQVARSVPLLYGLPVPWQLGLIPRTLEAARVSRAGAFGLTRGPDPLLADRYRELLEVGDSQIRAWAAVALGEVGKGSDLALLRPLLEASESNPVVAALRAAGDLVRRGEAAPPEDWKPRLGELTEDPRSGVRSAAIRVSGRWLLAEPLGSHLATLAREGGAGDRAQALLALVEGGDPRAPDLVAAAVTDAAPSIRRRAAPAAVRLADEELLVLLITDPEPAVRGEVLRLLLEGAEAEAAPIALEGLRDQDPGVRTVALRWLQERPMAKVGMLQSAIRGSGCRKLAICRLAGVHALVARGESESLERGAVVAALEELAADPELVVARAAAQGLKDLERPMPPTGRLGDDWRTGTYREIVSQTGKSRLVVIETRHGELRLQLDCPSAPKTCLNFLQLVNQGFYDGLTFHRLLPGERIEGGDPRGDGLGGPGYSIRDEINRNRFERGVLGMSQTAPDTGGSRFFLTLAPQPRLDGLSTAFGSVVAGEELLDLLAEGDLLERVYELR